MRHCCIATTVRLACVKPAASVRSEPGSNSQVDFRRPEGRQKDPDHYYINAWLHRDREGHDITIINAERPNLNDPSLRQGQNPDAPTQTVGSAAHASLPSINNVKEQLAKNKKRRQTSSIIRTREPVRPRQRGGVIRACSRLSQRPSLTFFDRPDRRYPKPNSSMKSGLKKWPGSRCYKLFLDAGHSGQHGSPAFP